MRRDEVEALVAARRELPAGHDQELIDAFMERVSAEIDARVDQRLEEQDAITTPRPGRSASPSARSRWASR